MFKEIVKIGNYTFLENGEIIKIQGEKDDFILTDPLDSIEIFASTKNLLEKQDATAILDSFKLRDNFVYYFISIKGGIFFFKKREDSLLFVSTVLEIQELILKQTFEG